MAAEGRMEGRKGEKSSVTVAVCPSVLPSVARGGGKEFKIQTVSLPEVLDGGGNFSRYASQSDEEIETGDS